ncbi:MAG: dihydroxy-acid dehydratase [Thermomicrobiales bacterium]|nr:dihydroxy-acid dehydratase [Thermomicrobiales bacterium]
MSRSADLSQRGKLTWYGDADFSTFMRRAFAKGMGLTDQDLEKPVIGIANSWSELNHCNSHLREVAAAVKRGVLQEGGIPLEFPTISLGELFISPTSMFLRNLMAMDTEEMIRAQPIDGVVLLAGCDKTTPAQLMGAVSADVPAIMVTGGPMLTGRWRGRDLGACTDCRRLWTEYRAGNLNQDEISEVEGLLFRSHGHCTVMGTASSMASVAEALGMTLPNNAAIPAPDSARLRHAEDAGRRIVHMIEEGLRPSMIVTRASIENAIRVLCAIAGSTNGIVHLLAIARRAGIPLDLADFDRISQESPLLANVKPSGDYQMAELFEAGGIPAVMKELLPQLNAEAMTVTGKTVGENLDATVGTLREDVIARVDKPFDTEGGLSVLYGNLAPDGAVIKHAAATPALLQHTGRAVVFTSLEDMARRVHDPDLDVTPQDVLVLQNAGPIGGPGMPEAGMIPIPKKLLEQGVRDLVRISDARMSGTAFGTVVLHIAPEAAVGGPLLAVRDGDLVELDVSGRRITLHVAEEEIARRIAESGLPERDPQLRRGYGWLHAEHVTQANHGCDFDFAWSIA